MEAFTGFDRAGLFLSGGANTVSPAASLGGAISTKAVRGMATQYVDPVQGLIIEDATPQNGEGLGVISIVGEAARYTPPGGRAGALVEIAAGERKVLQGADPAKAVRVIRVPGQTWAGRATFHLMDAMNGVLAMGNVADADRLAGATHYRALFIRGLGDVENIEVWIETSGQAGFAVAAETPVAGALQTIADQTSAPGGVTWQAAVDESSALQLGDLAEGETIGLWLRRVCPPAGVAAVQETVAFNIRFRGE